MDITIKQIAVGVIIIAMILVTIFVASALDSTEDVFYIQTGENITGSFVSQKGGIAKVLVDWLRVEGQETYAYDAGKIVEYQIIGPEQVGVYRSHIIVGGEILNVRVSSQNIFFDFLKTYELYAWGGFILFLLILFIIFFNSSRSRWRQRR